MMMIRTKSQHIIWFADDDDDNDQDKIPNLHLRFCLSGFIPHTSDTLTEQKSNLRTTDGLTDGSDGTENSHTWQCEPLQSSNNGRCSCELEIERSKFAINTGFHAQQFSFDRKYFSTELRKLVERNSLCSNFRSVTTIIVITINRYIMRRARWQERKNLIII